MFCSLASFGQNRFGFKSIPNGSGIFKALPTFPDIRIPGFNWMPNSSGMFGKLPFSENNEQLALINQFRGPHDSKATPTIIPDQSNMPMVDLSKGFSSNLPVKRFSKDYPSNMPVVGGGSQIQEMLFKRFDDGHHQYIVPSIGKR